MVKENGMVMLTENELEKIEREHLDKLKEYEKRLELLRTAVRALSTDKPTNAVRVSRVDFLSIYNTALEEFFDNMEKENSDELPNDIDGYNFTVHWHGIYCDCFDGAAPSNYIIPAIEGIDSEDPTEY